MYSMRLLTIISWVIAVTSGTTGGIAFQDNQSISIVPSRLPTQTPVPARTEQNGSPGETGTALQTQSASYSSSPSTSSAEQSPIDSTSLTATASFAPTTTPSRNITGTNTQAPAESNLGPIVGGSLAGTLIIGFLVGVAMVRRNAQRKRESLPLRFRRHTVANSVVTPNPISTYSYNTKSESVLY